jgi:NAD(P)-dependent dehydrogenase (short-subunit alcohol dehydrogenase family)
MKLKQQVVLLTNCGNPVGQAIAWALAREGAYISMGGLPKSSAV